MRWLHLSDIHYNPEEDGRSTKQLRDKLPIYIRENNIIVDNVFITGDYRHAGKDSRNEEVIAKEAVIFIKKLLKAQGLMIRQTYILYLEITISNALIAKESLRESIK